MADDKLKELAEGAVALSYAFSDEAPESLNEALMMLMHTGEAQGYAVDILEQQMAALGFKFGDVDLAAVSLEDKLILMNMAIDTGNKRLAENKYAEVDSAVSKLGNSFSTLGDKSLAFLNTIGAFWALEKVMQSINWAIADISLGMAGFNHWMDGTTESQKRLTEAQLEMAEASSALFGTDRQEEIDALNKKLGVGVGTVKKGTEAAKEANAQTKEKIAITKVLQELKDREDKQKANAAALAIQREEEKIARELRADELARQRLQDELDRADIWGTHRKAVQEDVKNSWVNAQVEMADGMAEMVVSGKASFKDLAQSIIKDLIRIYARMMAVKLISGITGLFSGGGGMTKSTLSARTDGSDWGKDMFSPPSTHTGGIISHHAGFIPSYHVGLRTDERLARLQVGEAVVNRAGTSRNKGAIDAMNKGAVINGGGNSTTADIKFQVTAIDAASFNNYLVSNKHVIENIISRSLATNGSVRQSVKAVI